MENIKINFSIKRVEMTAKEFVEYSQNIILKLQAFDNIYGSPSILNLQNKSSYFFKKDLSDFNFENLYSVLNEEDIAYKNNNEPGHGLNIDSRSWAGFSIMIFFGDQQDIHDTSNVRLSISQGSYEDRKANISIEYSNKKQHLLTKEYIVKLIVLLTNNVDVNFANAITNSFFLKVRQKDKKSIGWINYSNDKNLLEVLEKKEIIQILRNGIIFSLSDTFPFNTPSNLIDRSKEIANSLKWQETNP